MEVCVVIFNVKYWKCNIIFFKGHFGANVIIKVA